MMKKLSGQKGLTLAEMLVTVLIFSFLTMGLLLFTTMIGNMDRKGAADVKLANDGRRAMEKMVWGTRAAADPTRQGIWEARTFDVINPTLLRYTDANNVVHQVRQNNLRLETQTGNNPWVTILDMNGAAADDPGSNTMALTFLAPQPNLVEIRLVLGQRVTGRWYNASLATKVFVRNL